MRLFKQHRGGNTSHSNSPDGSPRGISPARNQAYYPQDINQGRPEGAEDSSLQQPGDRYSVSAFSQSQYPDEAPSTVSTDQAPPLAVDQRFAFASSTSEPALRRHPTTALDEKETKRSKRSYFGIPSHSKEPVTRLVERSSSFRGHQPPQPTLDTTVPQRHDQQPKSANELSYSGRQRFPEGPEDTARDTQRGQGISQYSPTENAGQRRPGTRPYDPTTESIYAVSSDSPDPQTIGQIVKDTNKRPESPYTAYHPPRSAGRDSLYAYEAYRGRPPSQQSTGPPSPLDHSPKTQRSSYIESTAHAPIDRLPPQPSDTMGREEGSARRSSVQTSHGHGHETGQYSQFNGNQPTGKQNAPIRGNSGNETRRSTPPPSSRSREDLSTIDIPSLLQKHEELCEYCQI